MTPPSTAQDARINELESRLALQEHSIHELGSEVYQQQRQIAQLEAMVRELATRLHAFESAPTAGNPGKEVPPHY
jgi:uncharacterized coiled-coil protein SlyX